MSGERISWVHVVDSEEASSRLVASTARELGDQAQRLAEVAGRLSSVASFRAPDAAAGPPARDAHSLAGQLIQEARERVVLVQSSLTRNAHVLGHHLLLRLHAELLARGGEIRVLVPGTLLEEAQITPLLTTFATSGAQIRISSHELPTAAIFDRQVGLLSSDRGVQLDLIRTPEAARAMSMLYDVAWEQAAKLRPAHAAWTQDERLADILKTVSKGYTDDQAARALGLSVRTYRRRVAALLACLGATSRFQAGLRAAQLGLVEAST